MLSRIAAFIAGLVLLVGAAVVSVGVALCAPLGVFVVHRVERSRGRRLGVWGSWVSAVSAVLIALAVIGGVVYGRLPAGTWSRVRQAADSVSALSAKQPPPAWLDRLAPGAAERYSAQGPNNPRALNAATMIWGTLLGVGFLAGFVGTLGWGGTMLLAFSASGRWPHEPPAVAT